MKYSEWLACWLKNFAAPKLKCVTTDKYARICKNHIATKLGERELSELNAVVLQKFVAGLSERLAPNTVCGIVSVLKSSLKCAVEAGVTSKHFAGGICRPKPREKRVECFSAAEQRRLEDFVIKSGSKKLFGIVFCLYTGLRIGELLALKWKNIDVGRRVCRVVGTCRDSWENGKYKKVTDLPKTENSFRIVPIPRQLVPYLKQSGGKNAEKYFVEGISGEGAQMRSYQKTFKRLLEKLKIPHRGFHSLRHTFATRAIECGMDVKTLSEILGHKNVGVTLSRYAHSLTKHKTEMMDRVGRLLDRHEKKHAD